MNTDEKVEREIALEEILDSLKEHLRLAAQESRILSSNEKHNRFEKCNRLILTALERISEE